MQRIASGGRAMRHEGSLQDLQVTVEEYVVARRKRQSAVAEALQYALWVPLAAVSYRAGAVWLAYLLLTWFLLGELLLLYSLQSLVVVRWWSVLLVAVGLSVRFAAELALEENSYWRFFSQYVIYGTAALALVLGFVSPGIAQTFPSFLRSFGVMQSPAAPTEAGSKSD